MFFKQKDWTEPLGDGEGVGEYGMSGGLEYWKDKNKQSKKRFTLTNKNANNRLNLTFLDWTYDFMQSFLKRKLFNESRASRYGKKFGDFADNIAKNTAEANK